MRREGAAAPSSSSSEEDSGSEPPTAPRRRLESGVLLPRRRRGAFRRGVAGMLRQNGGSNKRGLGLTKLSTSNFFNISNSGTWGMGRSTKSNSLSSISSNSDCYDSTVVDPEYIMQLVNDVRKFADVLLYLKDAILSE
ncbi:hypothetical protein JRQ81_014652, partial [Phrynocephalus forsythii]